MREDKIESLEMTPTLNKIGRDREKFISSGNDKIVNAPNEVTFNHKDLSLKP